MSGQPPITDPNMWRAEPNKMRVMMELTLMSDEEAEKIFWIITERVLLAEAMPKQAAKARALPAGFRVTQGGAQ